MNNPYVVSADIYLLLKEWAYKKGFKLPPPDFYQQLRMEFSKFMKKIFKKYELVSEEELTEGINEIVNKCGLLSISLDRVYYHSKVNLEITRLVNNNGDDRGLGHRFDAQSLYQQFNNLRKNNIKEAIIIDDVIFSGALLERVSKCLSKFQIKTPIICAGIGIGEGVQKIKKLGIEVRCVYHYDEVIDEVCERDFYPGVPFSGRSLIDSDNVGVPYLLPFGNPGKWASIPDNWQLSFSKFCIQQTIRLFKEIENYSKREIYCSDLERKVILLPKDKTRFVDTLKKML